MVKWPYDLVLLLPFCLLASGCPASTHCKYYDFAKNRPPVHVCEMTQRKTDIECRLIAAKDNIIIGPGVDVPACSDARKQDIIVSQWAEGPWAALSNVEALLNPPELPAANGEN